MDGTDFFLNKLSHKSLVILIRVLPSDSGQDWELGSFAGEIVLSTVTPSAGKAQAVDPHSPET